MVLQNLRRWLKKKDINGVIFYRELLSEGLGDDENPNSYFANELNSYRTIHNNKCYQITIYDFFYTSGERTEAERLELKKKMEIYDQILSTFKFIEKDE